MCVPLPPAAVRQRAALGDPAPILWRLPHPSFPLVWSLLAPSFVCAWSTPNVLPPPAATMERLIPVINRLHETFARCGLKAAPVDLPQITVVGSQSSGKSSVLEALVGFDFLPRGSGIVTRCPIVIEMMHVKAADPMPDTVPGDAYVMFLSRPGELFTDMEVVRTEIAAQMEKVAGSSKGISPTPVIMRVFSRHVVDLTLIDLPGLTKVAVGDQPEDIEKLVREMILAFIKRPNAIVLAVHPANTDLATSDALQLAKRVDPSGMRTLGVITKLDLMDDGTDAQDMLAGRIVPLHHGYVGVVNRSQADIAASRTIASAREAESSFLSSHPLYASSASRMGAAYLATKLSGLLMEHIRACLPSLRSQLDTLLGEQRERLDTLGPSPPNSEDEGAGAALLQLLTRYANEFGAALDGRAGGAAATRELFGGARLNYIFHDVYAAELDAMTPFETLTAEDIRTAIRNATGHRTPLFVPEGAFELLVKRLIVRFLPPALACVDLVYRDLVSLADSLQGEELARFPRLRRAVGDVTRGLLASHKAPAAQTVKDLLAMESSFINTRHPHFVGGSAAMEQVRRDREAAEEAEAEAADAADAASAASSGVNGRPGRDYLPASSFAAAAYEDPSRGGGRPSSHRRPGRQLPDSPDRWVNGVLLGHETAPDGPVAYSSNGGRGIAGVSSHRRARAAAVGALPAGGAAGFGGRADKRKQTPRATDADVMPSHLMVRGDEPLSDRERTEMDLIRLLLSSYFDLVRVRVADLVPKAVMCFLVNKAKGSLQSELVTKLYARERFAELMAEDEGAAADRRNTAVLVEAAEAAVAIVNEVRDLGTDALG